MNYKDNKMNSIRLKQIIREEVRKVLKEEMEVSTDANTIQNYFKKGQVGVYVFKGKNINGTPVYYTSDIMAYGTLQNVKDKNLEKYMDMPGYVFADINRKGEDADVKTYF